MIKILYSGLHNSALRVGRTLLLHAIKRFQNIKLLRTLKHTQGYKLYCSYQNSSNKFLMNEYCCTVLRVQGRPIIQSEYHELAIKLIANPINEYRLGVSAAVSARNNFSEIDKQLVDK